MTPSILAQGCHSTQSQGDNPRSFSPDVVEGTEHGRRLFLPVFATIGAFAANEAKKFAAKNAAKLAKAAGKALMKAFKKRKRLLLARVLEAYEKNLN